MPARPIVIAHRGASGYLPEHTLESKALAYGLGADFIEQDVVATRDGALVVLHDIVLDEVTNVASAFPGRCREDGRHYVIDFELAEIRRLEVSERRRAGTREALFPRRFPLGSLAFGVATLAEEIQLIQGLNRSTGRTVGIYPEVKEPGWHLEHGIDLSASLLQELGRFGYQRAGDPVFVQCFARTEVVRMRRELGTALRLVQLLPASDLPGPSLSADDLEDVAQFADGVGLPYDDLVEIGSTAGSPEPVSNGFIERIRAAGLEVHPYTFRRDQLPDWASSLEDLLEFFLGRIGVDGLFCDFPDIAVAVRDSLATPVDRFR